jgi:hypothetical protein
MSTVSAVMGIPPRQTEQTTKALANVLAESRGINATMEDANDLARAFGTATITGMSRPLKQFDIVLTKPQQKMLQMYASVQDQAGAWNYLMSIIAKDPRFINAAAEALKKPGAQVVKLGQDLEEMQKRIGKAILPARDKMAMAWQRVLPELEPIFLKLQQGAAAVATWAANRVEDTLIPAWHKFQAWLAGPLGTALKGLRDAFNYMVAKVGPQFAEMFDKIFGKGKDLGGIFSGAIIKGIQMVGNALKWVGDNAKWLVPAVSAFVVTLGALVPIIWAINAALAINPVTLIIIGVAALVAGIVLLVKYWDVLCKKFPILIPIWNDIKELVHISMTILRTEWMLLVKLFKAIPWKAVFGALLFVVYAVVDTLVALWNTLVDAFKSIWDTFVQPFIDDWDIIKKSVTDAWDFIAKTAQSLWNFIKKGWTTVWGAITKAWTTLSELITGDKEGLTKIFQAIGQAAMDWIFTPIGKIYEKWKEFMNYLRTGIGSTPASELMNPPPAWAAPYAAGGETAAAARAAGVGPAPPAAAGAGAGAAAAAGAAAGGAPSPGRFGYPVTVASYGGPAEPHQKIGSYNNRLGLGDVAISPNLMSLFGKPSPSNYINLDGQRMHVADSSWYHAGAPTHNMVEIWGYGNQIKRHGWAARAMAAGGIVKRAMTALIGERGPEAVIPLRAGRRAEGLLNFAASHIMGRSAGGALAKMMGGPMEGLLNFAAARIMGHPAAGGGPAPTNVSFSPNITISGTATADDMRILDRRLRDLMRDFVTQFKAAQHHERRLSYESGYS